MKYKFLLVLSISIFLFCCGDLEQSIKKKNDNSTDNIEDNKESKQEIRTKVEIKEFYAWVDKLRVRDVPGLESKRQGAKFIDVLDEGEKVVFLGEKSSENYEVKLRGRMMNAPFYKVRTKNNKVGWIFAGALSSFPIDVEHYRVAIFFDNTGNVEEGGDFGYLSSEAMNELLGTGVESLYIDDDFDEIEIRNNRGEIIGVENIMKIVKTHQIGVVCVEKGRSHKYVHYSQDMAFDILDVYGLVTYEGCSG